jgi:3-oxoacyl-[acyl-carrier-protein] synthase II
MSYDGRRRVVITGMGVIAPNGQDLPTFWERILEGRSAAGPLTRFDASLFPSRIAAEIRDFDLSKYIDPKKARRFALAIQYAIAAAQQALLDATQNSEVPNIGDPERVGVIEGTSVSGIEAWLDGLPSFEQRGYRAISPFTLINGYSGAGAGEIALELGIRGHACTYSSGSASGNDVMGYALRMIQDDEADAMVAGGAEAPILSPLWGAFCRTKVMSTRNDTPATAMRPFDVTRDGFVLGEGAAFLVMEELSHALSRGARIYAEIVGHGRACEAYHSVAPHPDGVGILRAMERSLRNAGIDRQEVAYINAHGTATPANDLVELKAITTHFGPNAKLPAVSSTKAVTGHLLAAAGALETVVTALAIYHQVIPKTTNLTVPEPGWNVDLVPFESRPYPIDVALNLSSGFGGKNSCLALRRYRPRS